MLWIIEPHSDDAYLSLHAHITSLWKEDDKTIVTVFCDERRRKEAAAYAASVGCAHKGLMLQEGKGLAYPAGIVPIFADWGIEYAAVDQLAFPVGLQHPDHIAVRARLPLGYGVQKRILWLDTPYYAKLKLSEELQRSTEGLEVNSMIYSPKSKWKSAEFFKSQAKYFHFNPPQDMPRLEVTFRK